MAGVLTLFGLTGCNAHTPHDSDIVGTWTYDGRSDGKADPKEASAGTITFFSDGSFEARHVSDVVLQIDKEGVYDGSGTWFVNRSNYLLSRLLDPPSLTLVEDESFTHYDVLYSVRKGHGILKFVRYGETWHWVKYRKKTGASADRQADSRGAG
ncbi:hypothetical protein [Asticcacaulis solisilvae]|uniref:hypothetical protein n=1 Tax=Asticcacaulis solisilvae TaxID=1217274 RepID=UPI003FD7C4C5